MNYDSWKLDNPWDEAERRIRARRIPCADCDKRYATVCVALTSYLVRNDYLCEECADKREQRMLDDDDAAHDEDNY